MWRVTGLVALYGANAIGALGSLLVIRFATSWAGFGSYAQIALYFLSFAVLQALEPAVIRKAVDVRGGAVGNARVGDLFVAWTIFSLGVGLFLSLALAELVFSSTMGAGTAFLLLVTGVVDYVLGAPILRKTVDYSVADDQAGMALVAFIQNASRFTVLLLLLWVGEGHATYVWLLPLRRLLDYFALRLMDAGATRQKTAFTIGAGLGLLSEGLVAFGSTIIWLLLATEGIGLLVYLNFGEAEFGRYRALFDLASKLWFITSVFPLLLYPKLRKIGLGPRALRLLRGIFLISLCSYLFVAILGLQLAPSLFPILFPSLTNLEWLFFLVLLGVALTAHARFGLECLQAFGAPRKAALAAATFAFMMLGVFQLLAQNFAVTVAVGGAWFVSATVLAIGVDERVLALAGASPLVRALVPLQMCALLIAGATIMWT